MTLFEAAILALEIIVILGLALFISRIGGKILLSTLEHRSRSTCRATDISRAHEVVVQANRAYAAARDSRIAAESLERHLKGAAHV